MTTAHSQHEVWNSPVPSSTEHRGAGKQCEDAYRRTVTALGQGLDAYIVRRRFHGMWGHFQSTWLWQYNRVESGFQHSNNNQKDGKGPKETAECQPRHSRTWRESRFRSYVATRQAALCQWKWISSMRWKCRIRARFGNGIRPKCCTAQCQHMHKQTPQPQVVALPSGEGIMLYVIQAENRYTS